MTSGGVDNNDQSVAPVADDTRAGDTSMPLVPEAEAMEAETASADNAAPSAVDQVPPQKEETKKVVMSYIAARRAGIIKCKCNRPICPDCTACTRCTCDCPGNTRARRKGKKKSSGGGGGGGAGGGGDAPANRPPPKKKLRVAEIAAIETRDEILRRLRRTDRTVLVPVAADGTDAYTASCITDVLARFGASVTVAKVPECSFDNVNMSSSATTTTSMALSSSPSRSGGSSPTRRSAAAAAAATSTDSAHNEVKDLVCKTSGGGARIVADMTIQAASAMDWDMIVLPGGVVGCKHLRSSETLMSMLRRHRTSLKPYGAIGEAPAIVLASAKPHLLSLIDEGRGATCLPDPVLRSMLPAPATGGAVVQGNLVTAAGPGVALIFTLALGEQLYGSNMAKEIAKQLLVGGQNAKSEANNSPLQEVTKKSNDRKQPASSKEGQSQDDDDSTSKYKDCVLSAEDTFMEVVWPTLDTLGWSVENNPTGDGTVYCPPGVKRDAKGFAVLNGDECDDDNVYCLETKSQVVDFIRQRPISHSSAQHPVLLFTQCMERVDDLVKMGRIRPEEISLDSVLSEVKQNGNIAEVPLFDEFIWPQLFTLGWTIEEETRHRPKSYVAPHLSFKGADRFKQDFFAPTRKEVIDFLYEDDMWGSKDEVLKVLDVFQACVSVGNEMAATGLLIEKRTPLWLYLKARERRPALPWLSSHLGPEKEENKKEEKSAEKKENDEQGCEEGEDSKAKLNEKGGAPEAGQLATTQTDEAGVEKSDVTEVVEPKQEKDASKSEHLGV